MRIFLAYLFKFLFKFRPLRKHYFGIYKRFFLPRNLFHNVKLIAKYDVVFRILLNLDEWIQQQIFFLGIYDQPGISFVRRNLESNDIFIDIGANIGLYSLSATRSLEKGTGGMVYAFEPVSRVFERLKQNIEMNGVENIIPVRKALFDSIAKLDIYLSNQENMGMSSLFHHDHESGAVERVEAITLDDFVKDNGLRTVSMIKMDIEGAELNALKGMAGTLKRFKPALLVEISEQVLKDREVTGRDVFEFMSNAGYIAHILDDKGDIHSRQEDSEYKGNNYVFIHPENRQNT